jgi:hypothetical protein
VDDSTRTTVAFVAAELIAPSGAPFIFDRGRNLHVAMRGQVGAAGVDVFDFRRACRISGRPENLFDHGRATRLWLRVLGQGFLGFDYASAQHLNGRWQERRVFVFDFEHGREFEYLV